MFFHVSNLVFLFPDTLLYSQGVAVLKMGLKEILVQREKYNPNLAM
jgi:hypothetical protein